MELSDIKITLDIQEGKLGRPFRNSSVSKISTVGKWINRVEKFQWLYTFKYMDEFGGGFSFTEDYYGGRNNLKKI